MQVRLASCWTHVKRDPSSCPRNSSGGALIRLSHRRPGCALTEQGSLYPTFSLLHRGLPGQGEERAGEPHPRERKLGEQKLQGGREWQERGRGGRCLWDPLSSPSSALYPPPKWAPHPATPLSSGLHVLGLHLNTHSPTICLGLSEDQWGSQGLAQQEAAGKSLTRAGGLRRGPGRGGEEKPGWEQSHEPGSGILWGRPQEGLAPSGEIWRGPRLVSRSVCLLSLGTSSFPTLGSSIVNVKGLHLR